MNRKSIIHLLAWAFFLLVLFNGVYLTLARKTSECQVDLVSCRYAYMAFSRGMDPYQIRSVSEIAGKLWRNMYAYHPFTLFLFGPFVLLGDRLAYPLYFFIRLSCAAALIFLWWKQFLRNECALVFLLLFTMFMCNRSMLIDFNVGNVEVFEALALWLAFTFFLKRRIGIFCLFVLFSSIFRLSPIVFLLLALLSDSKRRYVYFCSSFLLFLVFFFLPYLDPRFFMHSFIDMLSRIPYNRFSALDIGGIMQPSGFAAISEAVRIFLPGSIHLHLVFYLVFVGLVISATLLSVRGFFRKIGKKDLVYLSCFLFALLVPRFKDYSYYLLVPCFLDTILKLRPARIRWDWILFVLICVPYMPKLASFLYNYYPIFITLGLWILFLVELRQRYEREGNLRLSENPDRRP